MDALTAQSLRRLCERLESFPSDDPIPALMAEYRLGAPQAETEPLGGFEEALLGESLRQIPDAADLIRRTWLAAAPPVVAQFRRLCRDAGRVAILPLRGAGFHVGLGTNNLEHCWLWAIFELAQRQLPETFLRLEGEDVLRVCAGGVLLGEKLLANAKDRTGADPLAALIASAGSTRYWKLANVVDASLAALDIVSTLALPESAPPSENSPGRNTTGPLRNTQQIDVDSALGRLETRMRRELVREYGSESAADAALIDRLYSLSSEELATLLKSTTGFKISGKTIRRPGKSLKYESWERHRKPTPPPSEAADLGPAGRDGVKEGKRPGPSRAATASDELNVGGLSLRVGGRGIARTSKTAAERAAERDADQFARDAGIELPPAE